MPEKPSQTTLSPTALTDAEETDWLADLLVRAMAYEAGTVLAFILAFIPLPFTPTGTLTQWLIQIVLGPAANQFMYLKPPDIFASYMFTSALLAFVLSYPVLLHHALDLAAPVDVPNRSRWLKLTLLSILFIFFVGGVAFVIFLLPLGIWYAINWNPIGIEVRWDINIYIQTVTTLTFVTGLAFEMPALVVGMVWLRIISRERLAAWRPYAVLAAFVVGAVVTPTPDALNQAIVAVPICLLYELGLLLARFVPPDQPQPVPR